MQTRRRVIVISQIKPTDLDRESAGKGCYRLHAPLLLLSPKADTRFIVPQRTEG